MYNKCIALVRDHAVTTIGTIGGITGAFMVSSGAAYEANLIWAIANPFLLVYNIKIHEYKFAIMYAVYLMFAVRGVVLLR